MADMGFMNASRSMRETPASDGAFVTIAGIGQIVEKLEPDKSGFAHVQLVNIIGKPSGWVTASAVTMGLPKVEAIDKDDFVRTCWNESIYFGTNPHYLAAVAEVRSRTLDTDDGAYKGVYRLRSEEWADPSWKSEDFHFKYAPADIADWRKQATMFALMTLRATQAFEAANNKARPTVAELYLAQIVGLAAAKKITDGDKTKKVDEVLADGDLPAGSESLAETLKRNAAIFRTDQGVAIIDDMRKRLESVLQSALDSTRPFLIANGIAVLEGSSDKVDSTLGSINFDAAVISKPRRDIAVQIVTSFANAGFGVHHQVTALANAIAESSLVPDRKNLNSEESYGLFQFNFAPGALGSITSKKFGIAKEEYLKADVNINVMVRVAMGQNSFARAATLPEAMNAFVRDIENPKFPDAAIATRLGIAQALLRA